MKRITYLTAALIFGAFTLQAQTILLNGGPTGTQAGSNPSTWSWTDTDGNAWNSVANGFNSSDPDVPVDLLDISGVSSGITITSVSGISSGASDVPSGSPSGLLGFASEAGDYIYSNGNVETIEFAGLKTDGTTYTIRIWGSKEANRSTKYQFDNGTTQWESGVDESGSATNYLYHGTTGSNPSTATITISGVTPDASGNLTMGFNGSAGDGDFTFGTGSSFGYFGAAEIIAVPEPSSLLLMATAGLAMIALGSRRRKTR